MLASILASGLAAGAIYALVGVTYNTMFSTSRVMSFTAGQLAMLGGVFGSMFTLKLGMPIIGGLLLTLLGCAITIAGLEYLYRRTLVGRAFLAIAEDNFAARALGLPERNLRVAGYALAGVIGGVAGFSGGELLLAFFANGALLNFYGFVPVADRNTAVLRKR